MLIVRVDKRVYSIKCVLVEDFISERNIVYKWYRKTHTELVQMINEFDMIFYYDMEFTVDNTDCVPVLSSLLIR